MTKRSPSPATMRTAGIERSGLSKCGVGVIGIIPIAVLVLMLLIGPLDRAARLLQRLLTGDLLPRHLLSAMLDQYPVGRPIAGRPWKTPAYGLGLMIGETTNDATVEATFGLLGRQS
jgi:hypothetical protein